MRFLRRIRCASQHVVIPAKLLSGLWEHLTAAEGLHGLPSTNTIERPPRGGRRHPVTDLATGQRIGHGLRRALLAVWLSEDLGLRGEELDTAYYVALLGTVGCAPEMAGLARLVQDEIALGEQNVILDPTRPLEMAGFILDRGQR